MNIVSRSHGSAIAQQGRAIQINSIGYRTIANGIDDDGDTDTNLFSNRQNQKCRVDRRYHSNIQGKLEFSRFVLTRVCSFQLMCRKISKNNNSNT